MRKVTILFMFLFFAASVFAGEYGGALEILMGDFNKPNESKLVTEIFIKEYWVNKGAVRIIRCTYQDSGFVKHIKPEDLVIHSGGSVFAAGEVVRVDDSKKVFNLHIPTNYRMKSGEWVVTFRSSDGRLFSNFYIGKYKKPR